MCLLCLIALIPSVGGLTLRQQSVVVLRVTQRFLQVWNDECGLIGAGLASTLSSCSRQRIYALVADGRLRAYRFEDRLWLSWRVFREWTEERRSPEDVTQRRTAAEASQGPAAPRVATPEILPFCGHSSSLGIPAFKTRREFAAWVLSARKEDSQ